MTTHLGATGTDGRADAETVAAEEAFGAELTWFSPAALGFVISFVPTNTSSGFHVTGLNLTHHRGHCCCQVRGGGGGREREWSWDLGDLESKCGSACLFTCWRTPGSPHHLSLPGPLVL